MSNPPPLAPPPELTLEQAKAAAAEVETLFSQADVIAKIDALKAQGMLLSVADVLLRARAADSCSAS